MSSRRVQWGRGEEAELGPFVAWLAVRIDDEQVRRRCRLVVEAYAEWCWADGGTASSRRARFVRTATRRMGLACAEIEQALELLAEHRAIVARTLPVDG